jgi:hypothetical protein
MASKTLAMMRLIPNTPVLVDSQETRHFRVTSTRQLHQPDRQSNPTIVPGAMGHVLHARVQGQCHSLHKSVKEF